MLASRGRIVRGNRLGFAESSRSYRRRIDALLGEEIANSRRTLLRELLVEFIATSAVGVSFNLERQPWMREDNPGDFRQLFAGRRSQRELSRVKKDIRHVDDEAACRIPRFQDQIELPHQLAAQFLLFALGLLGRFSRLVRLRLYCFFLTGGTLSCELRF